MREQRRIVRMLALWLLLVIGISGCGGSSAVTGEGGIVSWTEAGLPLAT